LELINFSFQELPDETKDLAYKLSLATSIDAYKRTEILELEIQKKKKKIKAVIGRVKIYNFFV
jgi:hypothetical protein